MYCCSFYSGTFNIRDIRPSSLTAQLIPSRELCDWSRCGRTDKGVSSFSQVSSLIIKSRLPKNHAMTCDWKTHSDTLIDRKIAQEPNLIVTDDIENEINYIDILNNLLPPDIIILSWIPGRPYQEISIRDFHRTFIYYFSDLNLNINEVKNSCGNFIGLQSLHDFRNFCKIQGTANENL